MPRKKLTPQQAKAMLMADGMDFQEDFHALGSSAVQALADVAKLAGYRKSKNAPGSTVRMFYQYLSRVAPVVRGAGQLTPAERRGYQTRAKKTLAHSTKKSPAQLNREIAEVLAKAPERFKAGDVVQFRWEPSTGGVIKRLESDGYASVATPRGVRSIPIDALVHVRKEHESRVRRSVVRAHATIGTHHSTRTPFEEAKAELALIEQELDAATAVLRAFPRGATGLSPESVRLTPEVPSTRSM